MIIKYHKYTACQVKLFLDFFLEYFQWLRQEIIAQKGEAAIFKVDSIEGMSDQDIIGQFQKIRDKDYNEIVSNALKLKENIEGSIKKGAISIIQKERYAARLKKLKTRLNEVIAVDYFQTPLGKKAESAITNCNAAIENLKVSKEEKTIASEKISPIKIYNKNGFQNKRWVTRKGLHVDRIASGWLIKRFIDKAAKFSFVAEDAGAKTGIGFDIYNVEFSHRREDCTFETLLKSFGLKDSALVHIAQIVHDIDLKDGKFNRKEAEGINQIITGLRERTMNDRELLERGREIFDSLYQYYSSKKRKTKRR